MLEFRAGRALRAPHTTVRTDAPVSPVREFTPHPHEMGAYKKSPTWSKEGDAARDALFRSQWAHLPENATAEALEQCAAPLKVKAVRVIDHLDRFVREGLDDLDRAAPALATLGATLASAGVRSADYDDMIAGLLLRAERAADPGFPSKKVFAFEDAARQSWASVLGAFVEMLEAGAPGKRADKTPVKTRAERKRAAKKTRWTGGLYKQFAVAVGLKTPKSASSSGSSFTDGVEPVAFNLDQSDSIASPGPGAGPKAASTVSSSTTLAASEAYSMRERRSRRETLRWERSCQGVNTPIRIKGSINTQIRTQNPNMP